MLDWEKDQLDKGECLAEHIHPEIPVQLPGIDLASEQDDDGAVVTATKGRRRGICIF